MYLTKRSFLPFCDSYFFFFSRISFYFFFIIVLYGQKLGLVLQGILKFRYANFAIECIRLCVAKQFTLHCDIITMGYYYRCILMPWRGLKNCWFLTSKTWGARACAVLRCLVICSPWLWKLGGKKSQGGEPPAI